MSDTTENTDPTSTVDQDENTSTTTESDHDDTASTDTDTGKSGNSEAARYRRQLRDTEAQRDQLADRLTAYERTDAERHADRLADPRDLWTAGVELDDLRNEDGTIDPEKVRAAADQVLVDRPHWAKSRTPAPDRRQGGVGTPVGPQSAWSNILKR